MAAMGTVGEINAQKYLDRLSPEVIGRPRKRSRESSRVLRKNAGENTLGFLSR